MRLAVLMSLWLFILSLIIYLNSVKMKSRDPSGGGSPWSDPLPITIPRVKTFDLPVFIQWLFERFPFLQHIFHIFL